MTLARYQIGGSLTNNDPQYVVRSADTELYEALIAGEFCYVFNCRQMGKSSLLVRILHRLEAEGYRCAALDMTNIGSENITPSQWYKGIIYDLGLGFNQIEAIQVTPEAGERRDLSPLQSLSRFIADLLAVQFPQDNLVIFVDEVDSILSLDFPIDDFFAFIRYCYNQRAINPDYQRITFALFGVATPSDLIADKTRTPFNIGKGIELNGFEWEEAQPLTLGLREKISQPEIILKEILKWTAGQPFLTQKLCDLAVNIAAKKAQVGGTDVLSLPSGSEAFWVESIVRKRITHNWESQDEPEHLRTIRDRLLRNEQRAGRLLGIHQLILQGVEVPADDSPEQMELILSGLVSKQGGLLKIKNPIYQQVFNLEWIEKQLSRLRPYSQTFDAWMASKQQDTSRLLRGQALQDAQLWAQGKSLSDWDYQFLAASVELDRKEVQQALEAANSQALAAQLAQEQKNAQLQRWLLRGIGAGFAIVSGLGIGTFLLYQRSLQSERQARLSEIQAIASSSEGRFDSKKRLDALIQAIQAKRKLQQLSQADPATKNQVELVLRRAIFGLNEFNRFSSHTASVYIVKVSPDGQIIASGSLDGTVKLWRSDGTLIRTLTEHQAMVRGLAFSSDGQYIISSGHDKTVRVWTREGVLKTTIAGHNSDVWGVDISPDRQLIASASFDNTVKLWRLDGTLVATLAGHANGVLRVSFSPDSRQIASASADGTVKIWQTDGTSVNTLNSDIGWVWDVAWNPQGTLLASAGQDKTIKLWKPDGTLVKTLTGHTASVQSIAFSPDGNLLASASLDKTIKLWRLDGTNVKTFEGQNAAIWGVTFSPDGRLLFSAGGDNKVTLWQLNNPLLNPLAGHADLVWRVAASPDSSAIASLSGDRTIKIWSRDGELRHTINQPAQGAIAFSPDGKIIAVGQADKKIGLFTASGQPIRAIGNHDAYVGAISFSPDGKLLVSGDQKNLRLWKLDGTLLKTFTQHQGIIFRTVFHPDGQRFASVSNDKTLKIWKIDGTLIKSIDAHNAPIWNLAASWDGNLLATASADNTVKIWTWDGTLKATLSGDVVGIWGVAFSPDNQIIATGGLDSTIKLWKVDGTLLGTLFGHEAGVRDLAFSADGTFLVSGSDDARVILWNLPAIVALDELPLACNWVRDYLGTSAEVAEEDRHLCDGVVPPKGN